MGIKEKFGEKMNECNSVYDAKECCSLQLQISSWN